MCSSTHRWSLMITEGESVVKQMERKWFVALKLSVFGPYVLAWRRKTLLFLVRNIMRVAGIWVRTRSVARKHSALVHSWTPRQSRVRSIRFLFLCSSNNKAKISEPFLHLGFSSLLSFIHVSLCGFLCIFFCRLCEHMDGNKVRRLVFWVNIFLPFTSLKLTCYVWEWNDILTEAGKYSFSLYFDLPFVIIILLF
jgi:hypothetical protein